MELECLCEDELLYTLAVATTVLSPLSSAIPVSARTVKLERRTIILKHTRTEDTDSSKQQHTDFEHPKRERTNRSTPPHWLSSPSSVLPSSLIGPTKLDKHAISTIDMLAQWPVTQHASPRGSFEILPIPRLLRGKLKIAFIALPSISDKNRKLLG